MSQTVSQELKILGSEIVQAAKKNSLPKRDTGRLYKSINHKTAYISDDKFIIEISMVDYGDYVNKGTRKVRGTHFLDKAIDDNLKPENLDSIIDVIANNLTIKKKK
jgi:hypothetical protein